MLYNTTKNLIIYHIVYSIVYITTYNMYNMPIYTYIKLISQKIITFHLLNIV